MVKRHTSNRLLRRLAQSKNSYDQSDGILIDSSNSYGATTPHPHLLRYDSITDSEDSSITTGYKLSHPPMSEQYAEYTHLELVDGMDSMQLGDLEHDGETVEVEEDDGSSEWETVFSTADDKDIHEHHQQGFFQDGTEYNGTYVQLYGHGSQYYGEELPGLGYGDLGEYDRTYWPSMLESGQFDGQNPYEYFGPYISPPEPVAPIPDSDTPEVLVFPSEPQQSEESDAPPLVIETWAVPDESASLYHSYGIIREVLEYLPGVGYPFTSTDDESEGGSLCTFKERVFEAVRPGYPAEGALWNIRPRSAMDRRKGCWRRLRERGEGASIAM